MAHNNMFKRTAETIIAIFLLVTASVASPFVWSSAQAEGPAPASPALWKLTDPDSEVWLFGTVHILDPELSWHSQKVSDAFEAADTIYFEIPTDAATQQQVQAVLPKYGLNPAGVTLTSLISEEGKKSLKAAIAFVGLQEAAIANFEPLRPWLAGVTLATIQMQKQGLDPNAGVEKILTDAANAAGKKLAFLETPEQQLSFFGSLDTASEVAFFENGLKQMVEQPDLLDDITADWVAGNAGAVGEKMSAAMDIQIIYETLLSNRNKNWATQIKQIMDGSGRVFVAVGTGHLTGRDSLQDYLEELGLKAVRVQ